MSDKNFIFYFFTNCFQVVLVFLYMLKKDDLSRRLLKYFLLSTLVPFLLIVLIGSSILLSYYRNDIYAMADSYALSLSREVEIYINQLKQILVIPSFSTETVSKIREIQKKGIVSMRDMDEFDVLMGDLISSIRYTGNDFHTALITSGDSLIYYSSNYSLAEPLYAYDWTNEQWYQDALDNNGKVLFLPPHVPSYLDKTDVIEPRASLVTTIRNYITTEPYAVIKVDFLPSMMKSYLNLEDLHVPSAIYVEDDQGRLVFYNAATERMSNIVEINNGIVQPVSKSNVIDFSKKVEGTPYTLHLLLDRYTFIIDSLRFYAIGIGLYIMAILTAIYLNHRFSKRISEPVECMIEMLSHVEKGDFSTRYVHNRRWELEKLGNSLNDMSERLELMIDRTYKAQIAQKEAENKALLSQIQPHFIFNTLNTMVGLIYQEKYLQLEENIYCLSEMLRTVLKKDLYCTIGEEVDFIRNYLTLQSSRFENRLSYEINVDSAAKGVIFPRLLLQPFVENSIVHGMEPSNEHFRIVIDVDRKDDCIFIRIEDNGIGFDMDKINVMGSIGIRNCSERLSLLYENSHLLIESKPGKGCLVFMEFKVGEKNEIIDC